TEAQWEHAARAGTVYRQGQQSDPDQIGWFSSNSGRITREVGLKPANAWGLHDMHGNVSEWVWDWFALYPAYAQTDPAGAASGSVRVLRGGSHGNTASADLPAQRAHGSPLHRDLRVGLRLVRPHKARP
ncbi:MAG: formylglycine-generating enzyme family protein, partial [Spirochaetes bacterium]|nr:formylglycine-generating enzyme family protein [Spirochaetota bacterium]